MKYGTVPFEFCDSCGKRGWHRHEDADKALGRARAKRNRTYGNRRGLVRENRVYECASGLFHLTHVSRRVHQIGAAV